jgi:transposase InsO family protein
MMCQLLEVSRSGYYDWKMRGPSQRQLDDEVLKPLIRDIFWEFNRSYGAVRVWKELVSRGIDCGRDRVNRLLKEMGLVAKATRKKKPKTTDSAHGFQVADNLLMRDFRTTRRDEVWLVDLSYLATREGWVYLAAVLDLHSRRIVGWSVRDSLHRQGALDALEVAIGNRRPEPGLIHHSDRGSQYASDDYQKRLEEAGIRCSMSRKGDCWDNAPIESFFGRMKEELDCELFETKAAASQAVFKYIEMFYNPKRRHSSLGYLSPVDFERQLAS